jgi:biotin operon repressor
MEFKASKNKDLRHYIIAPIRACKDKTLKASELRLLLILCSYCDRTGVTFVSQDRLAADYGASRQMINQTMKGLKEKGYWVYAKKRYKDQKTNSIKIIYDLTIKTESLALSNLPVWQQMEHALEQVKAPEVAPKQQVKAPELSGGESPRACTKHTNEHKYINTIVVTREQTLKYLSRYTKLGDTLGQVRTYDIRQFEMMERWIREGLSELQWMDILNQHYKYCKDTRKPIANSLGYFKIPVEKILSKTGSHKINSIIKGLGRKFKS